MQGLEGTAALGSRAENHVGGDRCRRTQYENAIFYSVGRSAPGKDHDPEPRCKVSGAQWLWSVEPKTLLKTPGTWFESLLHNRNPKQ